MTPSTVAFVGGSTALSPNALGIFRRCGFVVIEHHTLDQVRESFTRGRPPAFVVVLLRAVTTPPGESASDALCTFVQSVQTEFVPSRVVVLCPRQVPEADLRRWHELGLVVVRSKDIQYRRVARTLIDLTGGNGADCCPSDAERQSAT